MTTSPFDDAAHPRSSDGRFTATRSGEADVRLVQPPTEDEVGSALFPATGMSTGDRYDRGRTLGAAAQMLRRDVRSAVRDQSLALPGGARVEVYAHRPGHAKGLDMVVTDLPYGWLPERSDPLTGQAARLHEQLTVMRDAYDQHRSLPGQTTRSALGGRLTLMDQTATRREAAMRAAVRDQSARKASALTLDPGEGRSLLLSLDDAIRRAWDMPRGLTR